MRIIGAIAIVAAMGGAAVAGPKPTAAEARKTVEAWAAALAESKEADAPSKALVALTATPFRSALSPSQDAQAEGHEGCADTTAADAAALDPALRCLGDHGDFDPMDGTLKAWSKKQARASSVTPAFKKDVRALEKTTTLVALRIMCSGAYYQESVFAVTKGTDGTLKVAAVLSTIEFCGE